MNGNAADLEALRRGMAELERQIDAVRRIAVSLSTVTEVEDLVREALNTSLALAQSEAGSILLYDPANQKLVFEYVVGEKASQLTGTELEADQGLAGMVFRSGKTFVSEDVGTERAHFREVGQKVGYVTRNMVTVPLMSAGTDALGVMQVLNKRGGPFDNYDVKLIEIIAAQIAAAITTVRLHEEARLATVVRFIGNISHDVKNMISPPITAAQTLQMVADGCFQQFDECLKRRRETAPPTSEFVESMAKLRALYPTAVEMILEGCDIIQQRTAQIAAAVKGVTSEPHFESTDIASIAHRVGIMLTPQAQSKGVALTIEDTRGPSSAVVDGKQIYNAVYNLILNAIDACEKGDSVAFRCGAIPEGEYLTLECADTGPGIPEEIKSKLFGDDAVSTKPMGTGLGTRIVKDVVDAHNGMIEVESAVGVGTTIRCRIPLWRGSRTPDAAS